MTSKPVLRGGSPAGHPALAGAASPSKRPAVRHNALQAADRNPSAWRLQAGKTTPSVLAIGSPLASLEGCVYLDWNATTPIYPEVAEEMLPVMSTYFGNPSSTHVYGRQTKELLDISRERVARAIGALPEEVYFTSCGTESDNWAIMGAIEASTAEVPHVVTTNIEHPAIINCLRYLVSKGKVSFSMVGVDEEGIVDPAAVAAACRPETCLVSVMHCNNEIGSVQPIREISQAVRDVAGSGVMIHTDSAQSFGKVPVDVEDMGVDMATFVGHKIGAPKGVAALYVKKGLELPNILHGGGQEHGKRGGTESMVLLAGLGKAAQILQEEGDELRKHMKEMRDRLATGLLAGLTEERVRINGPKDDAKRAANTLSVSIKGVNASLLLLELKDTVAASAGAACKRGEGATLSETLKAIKLPPEYALGTVRLSVGRHTTREDIDRAIGFILEACKQQGVPA